MLRGVEIRWLLLALLAPALLAACATTPTTTPNGGFSPAATLAICPGTGVANAPVADARGRIANFSPVANVRGVKLLRAPVAACVSSGFGPSKGGASSVHEGVDLYTGAPRDVAAAGGGQIEFVKQLSGYGLVIEIRHANGVSTRYAHLSSIAPGVRPGARVREGALIARTGRTGNATAVHLHYEIRIDGRPVNPLTVGQ